MNGFLFHSRRKSNESGFILPVTLMVAFLLLAFVLHEIKMYETEKQFIRAREEVFLLNGLMRRAAYDLERRLPQYDHGTLHYTHGKVEYDVDHEAGHIMVISLKAATESGGIHVSRIVYDKIKQKIVRWEEI